MSESKIAEPAEEFREDVIQCGSPSLMAMTTLALGLFSFLAVFKPVLWVFPVTTICLGCASLYVVQKNPLKIGRKAALIGLALAIFFLAWGSSHYFLRQQWLTYHARRYAEAWLELVRSDQLREAHQLHLRKSSRLAEGVTMDDYYGKHPYAQGDFESFYDHPQLQKLLQLPPSAKVVYERLGAYDTLANSDTLTLVFRAEMPDDARSKSLPVQIVMVRDRDPATGEFDWCVERVVDPNATATTAR